MEVHEIGEDYEKLKTWLSVQPGEQVNPFSRLIALRSALRSLPKVATVFDHSELKTEIKFDLTLATHRATFLSWVARKIPTHDMRASAASAALSARSAALSAASAARSAASAARSANSAARSANSAARSADSAARSADSVALSADSAADSAARSAVWSAVRADCAFLLENNQQPDLLLAQPLWNEETPEFYANAVKTYQTNLSKNNDTWQVWIDWHLRVSAGKSGFGLPSDIEKDLCLQIATQNDDFWEQSVHEINSQIADWVEEAREEVKKRLKPEPFVFMSYASANRERIRSLKNSLSENNIKLWWDQDIQGGQEWRTKVSRKLNSANVVLTSWTEASSASKAVREEASKAQADNKLVHIRLDRTEIPFGFGETQYIDFDGWNGDTSDPRLTKLILALRQKLPDSDRDELQVRTPLGERLVLNDNHEVQAIPSEIGNENTYENAIDKVSDAFDDAISEGNALTKTSKEGKILNRTLEKYRHNPQRVHDDFVLVRNAIRKAVDEDFLPDDVFVLQLDKALNEGAIDIRASQPEVEETVKARGASFLINEATEEETLQIKDAEQYFEQVSDEELTRQFFEDFEILFNDEFDTPAAEMPEARQNAFYRIASRASRMGPLAEKSWKTIEGGVWTASAVAAIDAVVKILSRWL